LHSNRSCPRIGEAIAIKFAEHGANVAFTYVSDSSAEKAAALETKLQGMGVKAKAYKSNAVTLRNVKLL
jgi:3-oxoacyl-[acyl-carrier protein] reductase